MPILGLEMVQTGRDVWFGPWVLFVLYTLLNHRGTIDIPCWKILPLNSSNNIRHDAYLKDPLY
jgi:hypothetical protein